MEQFIENNPYPTYEQMMINIKECRNKSLSFQMYSEYGKRNHELLKIIYNNITNSSIVKRCGEEIYKQGGLQAMQMNYYVLFYCTPIYKSGDDELLGHVCLVKSKWNGIGEWLS